MDVSKNNGTPKLSILIGFSIINHPFWGTPILGNTHIGFGDALGVSPSLGKKHKKHSPHPTRWASTSYKRSYGAPLSRVILPRANPVIFGYIYRGRFFHST